MTRDEIRGLIGAYATGALSAEERKAVFEAALDDQELFDDLAREQALKELLDGPGVKERLITALAPRQKPWWTSAGWEKAWVWAAAGAFAIAVIAGIVLLKTPRQEKPAEIAQVIAPRTAPPPPISEPAVPTAPAPAAPAPAPAPKQALGASVSTSSGPAIPELDRKIVAPKTATPPPAAPAPVTLAESGPQPPPTQTPAPAPASVGALGTVSAGFAARGGGGGGRGGVGGAANPATVQARAALNAALPRFAFDYRLSPEGVLRIEPASAGFLTVGVNNATAAAVLVSGRPVQAGSATEIRLPPDAVSAVVIFSAQAAPADVLPTAGTGAMDPPSGTKSDPNPSPSSRLTALIPVNLQR